MLRPRPRLFPLPPPERRRRSDVVVAIAITVAVAVTAGVMWVTSPHHDTVSTPASAPVAAPDDAAAVPSGFTQAWTAQSPATPAPVVVGPVVVVSTVAQPPRIPFVFAFVVVICPSVGSKNTTDPVGVCEIGPKFSVIAPVDSFTRMV